MSKKYKETQEGFPESVPSNLVNKNSMGVNYITQKHGVDQLNINALKFVLVIFSSPIFFGNNLALI